MKLLIAGLATETNTYSPIPTGLNSFREGILSRSATQMTGDLFTAPLHEWRRMAEERGWDVFESLAAAAQPAGLTVRKVYEGFRDEILDDLRKENPDIFLISMHGAMVADGYDDCEGDLLTRAREILGPDAIIGLEIDPHNHLTEAMLSAATLIIMYKEYPHIDSAARARDLFALAADAAEGKTHPVMRDYDCRMMLMFPTLEDGPAKEFVSEMKKSEGKDGILSLSLSHSFPYGDTARTGMRMLAIADGDADKAQAYASKFGQKLWDIRNAVRKPFPSIATTLDKVQASNKTRFVLADYADNAGGGAPADSTFVLQEVIARGMKDVALGIFWDPVLVSMCQDAGEGANLRVRLGGKVCKASGDPLDLTVQVRSIREDMSQILGEAYMPMGTGVWLESDGLHLVLSSLRTQCFHPSAFTELGVDLSSMKAIVVKSSNHFYDGFAPIASEVIHMGTPGTLPADLSMIEYTKRDGNFWPRVENPFA